MKTYHLRRYRLSLSSFQGIVFLASHWYCRIHWIDEEGNDQEADAECGRGDAKTNRFDTKKAARAAGLRLVRRIADKEARRTSSWLGYYVVTEGSYAVLDPQEVLSAPGNLKTRLNILWRGFEKFDGWNARKEVWPAVQLLCDTWSALIGAPFSRRMPYTTKRASP